MRTARSLTRRSLPSLALAALLPGVALAQPGGRSYTAGHTMLEVDGRMVQAAGVSGGVAVATVVSQPVSGGFAKKHIASIGYEPLEAQVTVTDETMIDWIGASWSGSAPGKAVRVTDADFNYKATGTRELMNARIVETTVPTLDGSSKESGYLTVVVAPEAIRQQKGGGADIRGKLGAKQKQWLTSNFRFELGSLPTARVAHIDSFTVRQAMAGDRVGIARDASRTAGALQFPDLHLTVSMADLADWSAWYDDFVVKGNNADAQEKSGAIVFLAPDMKQELGRITLSNCGITRLAPEPAGPGQIARFAVDLYCERMGMQSSGAAAQ